MLYAVKARFRPETEERRASLSAEFSDHIRQPLLHIRLIGALLNETGRRHGILMLMEADGREQVQSFLDQSPFTREGLYEALEIDELQIEAGSLG
ncbi:MAG: YciI family protein [Caulobacteraceae bacterium]